MIKKIEVFGTRSCGFCTKLKSFLDDNKVDYTYIDVTGDADAIAALEERSGFKGVPVTFVVGELSEDVVLGYKPDVIMEYISRG